MAPRPFARLLLRRRLARLAERSRLYRGAPSPADVERWQQGALDRTWRRALEHPFYRDWKRRHGLPDRIADPSALADFPVLRKADLQAAGDAVFGPLGRVRTIATGGSTGEPTRFPVSRSDLDDFFVNAWTGRSWSGLRPLDRVVFLWGHAHLMGRTPAERWARGGLRRWQDRLLNMVRLDAYRLSRERAGAYVEALERNPGAIVIAYASAFEKLLDHLGERGVRAPPWAPSHVILTSERVEPETLERVEALLGSVALVEYGTGELGVMAYSGPGSRSLRFLWASFHGRTVEADELVVTTLDDRLFPLVHYGTGDRLAGADDPRSVLACREVLGRRNDAVRLPTRGGAGLEVHSELLTHAVKTVAGVRSFLIVEDADRDRLEIRLLTAPDELGAAGRRVLQALGGEVPDLDPDRIGVALLEEEPLTLAGKRKFIERVPRERT